VANKLGYFLGLDIGDVRTGIAKSDPLNIFAISLDTIPAPSLLTELKKIINPDCEGLVVGLPLNLKGEKHHKALQIETTIAKIQTEFPSLKIISIDERFTSKLAQQYIIASGIKKEKRREKGLVDAKAAAIILQSYLDQKNH